jgi:hypothetical protein
VGQIRFPPPTGGGTTERKRRELDRDGRESKSKSIKPKPVDYQIFDTDGNPIRLRVIGKASARLIK